jgi:ubiquitin carboxyl-terminal hydrolase 40
VPCAQESGKVDFIDCDSPVDLMRILVEQHGGGPVSINRLCKELQEQTGVSWNKRFKRLYGPIKQFLTKTSDTFIIDEFGMVSLNPVDSSNQSNPPPRKAVEPQNAVINGASEPKTVGPESKASGTKDSNTTSDPSMSHDLTPSESREQSTSCDRTQLESRDPLESCDQQFEQSNHESFDGKLLGSHDNVTSSRSRGSPTQVPHNEDILESRDIKDFAQLKIDSIELLPIVEDHFQALKTNETDSQELCEDSLPNGHHRVTFLPPVGQCWFSFDDLWVRPITDQILRTAYQGKESAYMLFYRRKTLSRPREALCNVLHGIPGHLVEEVYRANMSLQADREKYDITVNALSVIIHFSESYKFTNGALQPNKKTGSQLCAQLTIDRRKTVQDLKELIVCVRERLNFGLDEMCLSRARQLPAGMHLYEEFEDTTKSLIDHGIMNDSHLFLWNGKTVDNCIVVVGNDCEPVLLSVSYSVDESNKTVAYHRQGYPKNMTLKQLRESLSELTGIQTGDLQLTHVKMGNLRLGVRKAVVLERSEDNKTLQELGLDNGEALTAELQESKCSSSQGSLAMAEVAKQNRLMSFIVENRCCVMTSDIEEWPVFPVEVDRDETVGMLKAIILSEIEMTSSVNEVQNSCRIRGNDDTHGLGPPAQEHLTIAAIGWTQGQQLVLEPGDAPLENEVVLFVSLSVKGVDKNAVELAVDRSVTIAELLALSVIRLDQTGDAWHICRTNWCGEVANILENEEATVEQEQLRDGDHLIVQEGKLPPKGFVRLAAFLCCQNDREAKTYDKSEEVKSTVEWVTHGIQGLLSSVVGQSKTPKNQTEITEDTSAKKHETIIHSIGNVEISKDATLGELKAQILTLPELFQYDLPSFNFLRVQELQGNPLQPAKVYRRMDLTLKHHKITSSTKICCTLLNHEETLSQSAILLKVMLYQIEKSQYGPPLEVIFDEGGIPTPQGLRQCIAKKLQFPLEKLVIAKHIPEKYDWVLIKGPNRQQVRSLEYMFVI